MLTKEQGEPFAEELKELMLRHAEILHHKGIVPSKLKGFMSLAQVVLNVIERVNDEVDKLIQSAQDLDDSCSDNGDKH